MSWKDVRVLVTGAGGFIGSHLVEELAGQGARVCAFVRYNLRWDFGFLKFLCAELRQTLEIVQGDLRDPSALLRAMDGCAYVFHLGAMISIPYSYIHPREVIETNILGTLNVLENSRLTRPTGSYTYRQAKFTGPPELLPFPRITRWQGQSPYSASKIGADKVAESYYRAFDVPVTTVRPLNTYGPRQSARAVIPTIITQALTKEHVRLGALTPTRDFTFVQDTVRGLFLRPWQTGCSALK